MNRWFDVPDSVGVWFGVRVMLQILYVVLIFAGSNIGGRNGTIKQPWLGLAMCLSLLAAAGGLDELIASILFLFGINPSGW